MDSTYRITPEITWLMGVSQAVVGTIIYEVMKKLVGYLTSRRKNEYFVGHSVSIVLRGEENDEVFKYAVKRLRELASKGKLPKISRLLTVKTEYTPSIGLALAETRIPNGVQPLMPNSPLQHLVSGSTIVAIIHPKKASKLSKILKPALKKQFKTPIIFTD